MQMLDIHGEKRDVVENIEVAQAVVELDAVEHARVVWQAEHVLGDQVAVAVDGQAGLGTLGQQRPPAIDVPQRKSGDLFVQRLRERVAPIHLGLTQVVRPASAQPDRATFGGDLRSTIGSGVEGGDQSGERPQMIVHRGAASDHRRQPQVLRHPAHDHAVLVVCPA